MENRVNKGSLLAACVLMLTACGSDVEVDETGGLQDRSGDAMGEVVADADTLTTLAAAFERTGLDGLLQGEASYSVFAPSNDAFAGLGGAASQMLASEEGTAIVAAILREHIVPGALTPEAIRAAIADNGGEVTMASFGSGDLIFTLDGDTIVVTSANGAQARLAQDAIIASNGVILPIDAVLVDTSALEGAALVQ